MCSWAPPSRQRTAPRSPGSASLRLSSMHALWDSVLVNSKLIGGWYAAEKCIFGEPPSSPHSPISNVVNRKTVLPVRTSLSTSFYSAQVIQDMRTLSMNMNAMQDVAK